MLELALVMLLHALGHADDLGAVLDLTEELLARVGAQFDVLARAGGHQKHLVGKLRLERFARLCGQFPEPERAHRERPSVADHAGDVVGLKNLVEHAVVEADIHQKRTEPAAQDRPKKRDPFRGIVHAKPDDRVTRDAIQARVQALGQIDRILSALRIGALLYRVAVGTLDHDVPAFRVHHLEQGAHAVIGCAEHVQLVPDERVDRIEFAEMLCFHVCLKSTVTLVRIPLRRCIIQ